MTKAQVNYEIVLVDELPPPAARGGGAGKSVLEDQLEAVKKAYYDDNHRTPVRIGLYSKGTAATAAKNVLQQRHGRTTAVEGFKFWTRPVPTSTDPDAPVEKGLFVLYAPDEIVSGAKEAHEMAEEKRKADLAAKREAEVEDDEAEYDEEDDDEYEDEE